MSATTIVTPAATVFDESRLAVAGFLARYSGPTRVSYSCDLRQFFAWCALVNLAVFELKRGHLELWARSTEERGLDRMELAAFIAQAAAGGVMDHALACLLGLLGLRVAEACSINIEDLSAERGHRIVTVVGKGSKLAVIPLPSRVARAVDLAAGERISGPLLLTRAGGRMNRPAATRIVRRVARSAGVTKHISPHSLRYS